MANLKPADLGRVKELTGNIAAHSLVLQLTATQYAQNRGYLDVEYATTNALEALKMVVIAAMNPLRDGLLERDIARLPELTGVALENIQKYGYKYVGALARPHMTFTRFTDEELKSLDGLPSPGEFSGQFPRLGLFEMGDNGTCVRKVVEFELGDHS